MNRISWVLFLACFLWAESYAKDTHKPNVVFILVDDMGYGDLGCYGHPRAKTPVIDRLAKEGVRFTQHYANGPECSPTRTAFLTGRYQQRAGGLECAIGTGNVGRYDDAIRLAGQRQLGLPAKQVVLPSALKPAGYVSGVFGKWHLGYEPQFNPVEHGWDDFFGYMGGNVHYFNHRETSELHVLYRGRLPVHAEGYMTHLITDSSINFIERHKDKPFFLYVSHECPHFPFQGPKDVKKEVNKTNWMKPDADTYVAMLEDLDSEVGRLLAALDKHKLADNTLVIFVSDNGGFAGAANMGPLNGAKSTTLEGGIRVPLIMRWPGQIRPGTTSHQVCVTFDLTRSILNLAQAKVPAKGLDGLDIVNHITARKPDFARTLFWRGKRGERIWSAVREGDLKYVRKVEGQTQEWLFDLSKDLAEKNDLSSAQPKQVARMKKLLFNWEKEVKPIR
ncbi:MAG: sulfatase-like hydrolase/transferase [Verrucomicrobiota bacterium]|nr:sulfatase-like hydrolase/transferase [Verrucomicrobiota bacterium]